MEELEINVKCFNLKDTLESGQCFRWNKVEENTYVGVIEDRVLKVRQDEDRIFVKSSKSDNLKKIVTNYFDLNTDYEQIEKNIIKIDDNIKKAVSNTSGIRILNQSLFEIILSFIISANNNIPRISRSINEISKKYGQKVEFENNEYYLFPTKEELENVTEEDFKKTGVGFRARYLKNTVSDILNKKIDLENLKSLDTQSAREELLKLQGVGNKVADCILLFSCQKSEVFPIDVWVERVMQGLYFKNSKQKIRKNDILEYANKHFGRYSGIVQQHLFHNVRNNLI